MAKQTSNTFRKRGIKHNSSMTEQHATATFGNPDNNCNGNINDYPNDRVKLRIFTVTKSPKHQMISDGFLCFEISIKHFHLQIAFILFAHINNNFHSSKIGSFNQAFNWICKLDSQSLHQTGFQ